MRNFRYTGFTALLVSAGALNVGCGGGGDGNALAQGAGEQAAVEVLRQTDLAARLAARSPNRVGSTGTAPSFVIDPGWPQALPNYWQTGNVGGLYVDHRDNIWVYQRPRELAANEAGGPGAAGTNDAGRPINVVGHVRPYGRHTEGSFPAPSVLKFDKSGTLLDAWGGPGDPGFLDENCAQADGCWWPAREHGIFVDHNDYVYVAGNGEIRRGTSSGEYPWATDYGGDDSQILKFTADGTFVYQIGNPGKTEPNSNSTDGGPNGTPQVYLPSDMTVDPETNLLYIADGYGNRRILIVEAETGQYVGHFGAYGQNPVDDNPPATDRFQDEYRRGETPNFFRTPTHCVKVARDGLLYVCDRENARVQIFNASEVGEACSNPNGEVGRCGYVGEIPIAPQTGRGTVGGVNFSPDPGQTCLYISDIANNTIYVVNRENLNELDRVGRTGRQVGQFIMLHNVSIDSEGSLYTGEVGGAKRVQKFQRYGATTCSGTHFEDVGSWDVYETYR